MKLTRKVSAAAAASMMALGVAAPGIAAAGGYCPEPTPPPAKMKCNAGRGNGSEGCDPGNSSTNPNGTTGQNQGGDEGGPIRGGTGAP
jgi:Spy/CpxP family protein refolding chaperone